MVNFFSKAQQFLFVLLGFSIPISIAFTNILLALLALCWLIEGGFKEKFNKVISSKSFLSVIALIILYVVGMFWGSHHDNSSWQFQKLALLLFFPVLTTLSLKRKTMQYGLVAFLIVNFISACFAILINYQIVKPLSHYISSITPYYGTSAFLKYNYHNVLLAFSSIICLYLFLEKKTKYRYLIAFFFIVYAVSLFTERGRAGQILFNIATLFYIIRYAKSNTGLKLFIIRFITLCVLLFSFNFIMYQNVKTYKKRVEAITEIIKNNGERKGYKRDIRYVFVEETIEDIFKKPFFGYGTGSFGTIFQNKIKTGSISDEYEFFIWTTPHNQYLYVWFETGILGLLFLFLIFYFQAKQLLKQRDGPFKISLPLSFLFLMLIDSYLFIFILITAYIYLYTIYSRYHLDIKRG
jgi:O-antigen ligase